jgi:hypothetical protein
MISDSSSKSIGLVLLPESPLAKVIVSLRLSCEPLLPCIAIEDRILGVCATGFNTISSQAQPVCPYLAACMGQTRACEWRKARSRAALKLQHVFSYYNLK